ncbi:MAG: hypothetical protein R3C19_15495 [Planctomycetaceae bacterium]
MFTEQRSPFRIFLSVWLLVSAVAVCWHLVPVLADYRREQQRLADLEAVWQHAPTPTVTVPEGSRWPHATIEMTGHSIRDLDDSRLSVPRLSFGRRGQLVAVSADVCAIAEGPEWRLKHEFFELHSTERLYHAALSGDGKVIATLGEFTRLCFRDAADGTLLQTFDEDQPLPVAELDVSHRADRHSNGLRYSNADVRKVFAAPGGCLFAVGKMDGTVELWAAEGQPLPDRPIGLVTPEWPFQPDDDSPAPRNFRRVHKLRPHEGRVEDMAFSLDCQSLLVSFGRVFDGMREIPRQNPEMPSTLFPSYRSPGDYLILSLNVATGEPQWQQSLRRPPSLLALDAGSQHIKGLLHPARFALLTSSDELQLRSLEDGSLLSRFSVKATNARADIQAMSFDPTDSILLTVDRQYGSGGNRNAVTFINAFEVHDGSLIASAELPGQVMHAAWSPFGHQLAMQLFSDKQNRPASPPGFATPFTSRRPLSPFRLHVWDVRVQLQSGNRPNANPPAEAE